MSILAILITSFLEQRMLLDKFRAFFWKYLEQYVAYFTSRSINTQRELRLIYLFACLPVFIILFGLKLLFLKHYFVFVIIDLCLFILSIQILTWKEEAKNENLADKRSFVSTYATKFLYHYSGLLFFRQQLVQFVT